LDVHSAVGEPLNDKHRDILRLIVVERHPEDDVVNTSVYIVMHCYIVDIIIAVQIEVVYPQIRIVKLSFEFLKGLRLLEEIHYRVKIEIVSGQSKVIVRVTSGGQSGSRCHQYCKDSGYYILFHDLEFLELLLLLMNSKCRTKKTEEGCRAKSTGLRAQGAGHRAQGAVTGLAGRASRAGLAGLLQ
jgi:hypothetical protein